MVRFLSLLFLIGTVQGQALYCGLDNGLSSKVTLSNLCTYSEQIDHANWTKSNVTISADSVIAPDGTLTADTITNAATTSSHVVYSTAITVVAGSTYRYSGYIKYGTHPYVVFRSQAPTTSYLNINLSKGVIEGVGSTVLTYTIRSVGNGWYYVNFTSVKDAGVTDYVTLNLSNSSYAFGSFLGAITEYVYFWGASLQLASAPPDYLATTTAAATLGPLCGSMQTQSPLDPTQCITMTNRGREIRTEAQIAIGSQ